MEKGLSATAVEKKNNNDVIDPDSVNDRVAQNEFGPFKEGDTSREKKPRSVGLSIINAEALLEMIEQLTITSTCTLWKELSASQKNTNRLLHKLGVVSRH